MMHYLASKISFRRAADLLPCLELFQIASISIQRMGPVDLERGQGGELNTSADGDMKDNTTRTTGLQR
jgi:hypothetical protein